MKYLSILAFFIFYLFVRGVQAVGDPCVCQDCPPTGPCTVSGFYGITVYAIQQDCYEIEPTCGGIPVNSNSWTLLIVGVSIVIVGYATTYKLRKY